MPWVRARHPDGLFAGGGRPPGVRLADLRRVWLAAWGRHSDARGEDAVRWWAYLAVYGQPIGGGDRASQILVTRWVPGNELLPENGERYGKRVRRVVLPADPAGWPAPPLVPGDEIWWGPHVALRPKVTVRIGRLKREL